MKIGIIGTRGIPNQYGGFEQFAEQFAVRMADMGHHITVYVSHNHPYKEHSYQGVRLVRCFDPEYLLGTAGQFIYDFNCIKHSRKEGFDVILQLGYTSSTIWSWLYPKQSILITNMDGLEWKRSKYNRLAQYFLQHAEKWGARYSDHLIADSIGIQEYLLKKYKATSTYIPYGAEIYYPGNADEEILHECTLKKNGYDLLIARFEPENNIETILKAYAANNQCKLVLVGNYSATKFGRNMHRQYGQYAHIHFAGPIYDMAKLNVLRYYARLYLHGHSVGGTNPSLLEAMACNALICAHNNPFNKYVLGSDAFYFKNTADITSLLTQNITKEKYTSWQQNNLEKIANDYNWDRIIEQIESKIAQWKYGVKYRELHYTA